MQRSAGGCVHAEPVGSFPKFSPYPRSNPEPIVIYPSLHLLEDQFLTVWHASQVPGLLALFPPRKEEYQ